MVRIVERNLGVDIPEGRGNTRVSEGCNVFSCLVSLDQSDLVLPTIELIRPVFILLLTFHVHLGDH